MPNQCPVVAPAVPPVVPAPGQVFAPQPFIQFTNQTLRLNMFIKLGGTALRVKLSNRFSTQPLVIGSAHVALRRSASAMRPLMPLTFSGRPTVTIPATRSCIAPD
jgi:hypothetical protein